jgi:hypothetical protein
VDDLYCARSLVRILQVDYYKTCKTFYSKKKRKWGGPLAGGGGVLGNKIKGKKIWKRRTMSYISTLFLFLKPQQSKGNKITVVKGGRKGLQLTEVYNEMPEQCFNNFGAGKISANGELLFLKLPTIY